MLPELFNREAQVADTTIIKTASRSPVHAAVANAAARTGVDFSYLLNQARVESSLNPQAQASTSSAAGLFQFTKDTWLGTLKAHGAEHGLAWAADAISTTAGGRHVIADPTLRQTILDLRFDADASSAMAGELASDNQGFLEAGLGRPSEQVDLYLAHFLGADGALKFLQAHDADPSQAAAPLFPQAAAANHAIFYAPDGSARSLGDIRQRFAAKLNAPVGSSTVRMISETRPTTQALMRFADFEPMPDKLSVEFAHAAYQRLAAMSGGR
jgi:hypothetical protein